MFIFSFQCSHSHIHIGSWHVGQGSSSELSSRGSSLVAGLRSGLGLQTQPLPNSSLVGMVRPLDHARGTETAAKSGYPAPPYHRLVIGNDISRENWHLSGNLSGHPSTSIRNCPKFHIPVWLFLLCLARQNKLEPAFVLN
jgi:hypothetical protein